MSCPNLREGRHCGDEGHLCDECQEAETREWEWLQHVSKYSVMPIDDEYYQELRDAGRTRGTCLAELKAKVQELK